MYEADIKVNDIGFINFQEFKGLSQVNDHSHLLIKGNISADFGDALKQNMNLLPDDIKVYHAKSMLLCGVLLSAELAENNGSYTLTIQVGSKSHLADEKLEFRTFQDPNYTYSDVARLISHKDQTLQMFEKGRDNAGRAFYVQYNETDWDFFKRITSNLGLHIFPNTNAVTNEIGAGFPQRAIGDLSRNDIYTSEINYLNYLEKTSNHVSGVSKSDYVSYIYRTTEKYNLCDGFRIEGTVYYIFRIESYLEGSILYHDYHLLKKPAFKTIRIINNNLTGATISGTVHGISGHKITVKIHNDIRHRFYRCFNYETTFSTPDGTGWYFMPEEGDTVRLRFPSAVESISYACSAVHAGVEKFRMNPDHKSISNMYDKSIVFLPTKLTISNGHG